ncbi:hypothetical protein VWJ19_12985, partial [Staphylococcus hominis]|uniref:hypothetical protein n=1 Tax=Staphylococcus hominis TaxID=1290 RepID=UPI002E19D360|nr:hypothetical protein [Staphylococcus hominis]
FSIIINLGEITMSNKEIYEAFEEVKDTLNKLGSKMSNKADSIVINKAINLIDTVAWQYEE